MCIRDSLIYVPTEFSRTSVICVVEYLQKKFGLTHPRWLRSLVYYIIRTEKVRKKIYLVYYSLFFIGIDLFWIFVNTDVWNVKVISGTFWILINILRTLEPYGTRSSKLALLFEDYHLLRMMGHSRELKELVIWRKEPGIKLIRVPNATIVITRLFYRRCDY